ncbi:MAG TPA: D-alanine--D-alanine ligase family protein [Candidatus Dormibacteraeota bacterium]|nr:D-alanine--D-alanine ligase family protein [Candidatus Dormibacteraeota bacterium]HVA11411.1 D-alanine--D-alanine ligase family protein [Candidatus Dormibacteraeota bacterium]
MKRLKLLLPYGGESAEHEVSVDSAKYIRSLLKDDLYDVALCYVDRNGLWWRVDGFDDTSLDKEIIFNMGNGAVSDRTGWSITPDVIFPIMLGPNGEDGSVQGLAQLLHVPVVGCGVSSSSVCMDKELTKRLLQQLKIPIIDYIVYYKNDTLPKFDDVMAKLGNTIFIKPARQGSSIGVTKASDEQQFYAGVKQALMYDTKVVIERAALGREVGCGVIGNQKLRTSVVSMIELGDNDFFTYDAKYAPNSSAHMRIPADLPADVTEKIRLTAEQAYKALECAGFARIDMFLEDDGTILINELNTIPAFRSDSSYPKLWKASGVEPSDLLDEIIGYAISADENSDN